MPGFDRYIGIDYSGAETPNASLKGLRVYLATGYAPASEVLPPRSWQFRMNFNDLIMSSIACPYRILFCDSLVVHRSKMGAKVTRVPLIEVAQEFRVRHSDLIANQGDITCDQFFDLVHWWQPI
jgi:hypothetical protein